MYFKVFGFIIPIHNKKHIPSTYTFICLKIGIDLKNVKIYIPSTYTVYMYKTRDRFGKCENILPSAYAVHMYKNRDRLGLVPFPLLPFGLIYSFDFQISKKFYFTKTITKTFRMAISGLPRKWVIPMPLCFTFQDLFLPGLGSESSQSIQLGLRNQLVHIGLGLFIYPVSSYRLGLIYLSSSYSLGLKKPVSSYRLGLIYLSSSYSFGLIYLSSQFI
jgi:hypothetical protein